MELIQVATHHLFFTGKGGVGKTSIACATAVKLADGGKRVLLISTDPASNLDEVLGTTLGTRPTAVEGVPGLSALNLDPEAAAREYRERVIGPYRYLLPPAAVASMEEQLSGACTVEIAAFDEFAKLLGDPSATAEFDHVLFDTAPTGHTLRLLTLPSAWTGFVEAERLRHELPRPARRTREAAKPLRSHGEGAQRSGGDDDGARIAPGIDRSRRGGADERRARRARRAEPAPRRERRVRGAGRGPRRSRSGAPRGRGARCDACCAAGPATHHASHSAPLRCSASRRSAVSTLR